MRIVLALAIAVMAVMILWGGMTHSQTLMFSSPDDQDATPYGYANDPGDLQARDYCFYDQLGTCEIT